MLPVVSAGELGLGDASTTCSSCYARRPLDAARDDDDDPRGLPRPRATCPRPQGLLRLPLLPDGAVGRPGVGRLHRRARRRRDARPQRPASGTLGRDTEGYVVLGSEVGRDHGRRPSRSSAGPPAAGQAVPGRPRARADRRGRGGQAQVARRRALRRVVSSASVPHRRPAAVASSSCRGAADALRQRAFGYSQEDLRCCSRPMARDGRGAGRLDGQRPSLAVLSDRRRRCSPTSSSCSRRSPTRRSTRSARRS